MFQFPAFQPAGSGSPAPLPVGIEASRHVLPDIDKPRTEILVGGAIVAGITATVLACGILLPMSAAVVANGTVSVTGERQKVQSIGDGSISAIRVTDGQHVVAGQPLVDFAAPDLVASERSYASRVISLQAEIAGLEAEQRGEAKITTPEAFALYTGQDAELARTALTVETTALIRREEAARAARGVLASREAQVHQQIAGVGAQREALGEQSGLMDQEVENIRQLAAKGYASRNRLLEMERSAAELSGSTGNSAAEAARLRSSAGEARMQLLQDENDRAQTTANRLRDARADLQSTLPQWEGAKAQLSRMQLRAPVAGTVTGLAVHTIGGVTQRGETVMEIVPAEKSLIIDAMVDAKDGNEVQVNKTVTLRVPGLHGRGVPQLHGVVTVVAANSETNEKTGQSYYPIHVRVAPDELSRLSQAVGISPVLRPGNPVQVVIETRPRSALRYWLDPILQTVGGALHEQ